VAPPKAKTTSGVNDVLASGPPWKCRRTTYNHVAAAANTASHLESITFASWFVLFHGKRQRSACGARNRKTEIPVTHEREAKLATVKDEGRPAVPHPALAIALVSPVDASATSIGGSPITSSTKASIATNGPAGDGGPPSDNGGGGCHKYAIDHIMPPRISIPRASKIKTAPACHDTRSRRRKPRA
jgi:hypothetical protein